MTTTFTRTQHLGGGAVHKGAPALQVDAEDALSGAFQQQGKAFGIGGHGQA